jgi:hypothetical protein
VRPSRMYEPIRATPETAAVLVPRCMCPGTSRRGPARSVRTAYARQVTSGRHTGGKNATNELAAILERLRPWTDRTAMERALRQWTQAHGWPDLHGREADVAQDLYRLGGEVTADGIWNAAPPDTETAAGITAFMLRNVAAGRGATEYDLLGDSVKGVPRRTIRHYRHVHGGVKALGAFFASLQYDIDLAALVHGGRSEAAARRWLERHPELRAKDAPPPRRHRVI